MKKKSQTNTLEFRVNGMTCVNCQNRIERALMRTNGVAWTRVSYADGKARVEYDARRTNAEEISLVIEKLGYVALIGKKRGKGRVAGGGAGRAHGLDARRVAGILVIVVAAFLIMYNFGFTTSFGNIPLAEEGMGYGLLFVIGLLTSVHCVAMCGGINISQCIPAGAKESSGEERSAEGRDDKVRRAATAVAPSLKYNIGRVCSYTAVGAAVGGIGSIVSLSGDMKGLIQIIAGVFMVIMGLSMFGVLPGIGRITPRLPRVFGDRIATAREKLIESPAEGEAYGVRSTAARGGAGPLIVGLLNGLMPCGPLQAMQLFALSTGSPAQGALSMLCFSLGTLPLMFGLGALSSALGGRFTSRAMVAGAALVVFLGLFMFTQGMTLSGVSIGTPGAGSVRDAYIAQGGQGAVGALDSRGTPAKRGDGDGAASGSLQDRGAPDEGAGGTGTASPGSGDGAYVDEEGNSYYEEDGVQVVRSRLGRGYPHITVKAGVPVQWVIDAPEGSITGCNSAMYIPEYEIEHAFETGGNLIEFTPGEPGEFMYSCWMGMIRSSITVVG
jgi:sulfite exporter TauE/SafE/copper chaperone CopZ